MMTSGERRGLIVLTVLLALIVVFVLCRKALFSPRAGNSDESVESVDTVAMDSDTLFYTVDSLSGGSKYSARKSKSRVDAKQSIKTRRIPVTRDPLSEPVN